jgi:hypothetical protein
LKKLLRKSNQALQQVIKRLMELFHIDEVSPKTCYDKRQYRFKLQHDSGPLLPNMIRSLKQYKELHFGPWYLSCKIPNNCVYLKDSSVILIENIVSNETGDFICGRRYRQLNNIYDYPIPSSSYEFFRVGSLSDSLECCPLINIKCKVVRVPNFVGLKKGMVRFPCFLFSWKRTINFIRTYKLLYIRYLKKKETNNKEMNNYCLRHFY